MSHRSFSGSSVYFAFISLLCRLISPCMSLFERPDADDAATPGRSVWFAAFCPHGTICRKGNKRLGTAATEEAARELIVSHLCGSSYHEFKVEHARQEANAAEIFQEEWEKELPPGATVAPKASSPVAAAGGASSSTGSRLPYARRPIGMEPSPAPSTPTMLQPRAKQFTELLTYNKHQAQPNQAFLYAAAQRGEQAARAASRIARQAAEAFDQEAENFRDAAQQIRNEM